MSRKSTDTFTYYNRNPRGLKTSADCVARAISVATGYSWENTINSITAHAIKMGRVFNEKEAYGSWLENEGWTKMPQLKKANNKRYTIKEFQKLHPEGIIIIKVSGHLTVIEDGILYDTWNCERASVGNYWVK